MEFRDLLAEGFPSVIFLMGGLLRPPRGFHDTAGRSGGHGDGGDVRLPLELWCEGVEGFIDCPKPATDQRDAEDGPKLFCDKQSDKSEWGICGDSYGAPRPQPMDARSAQARDFPNDNLDDNDDGDGDDDGVNVWNSGT
jgi:hypothetical protein